MTNYPAKPAIPTRIDQTSTLWLRSLDEIEGNDLPLVGGKAFRLATLKRHGLHVPPGLVLTTNFFETQLQHAQVIPLWAGSPDVAVTVEALGWLADVLKTKPLAKELSGALNQALDDLFGSDAGSFAVRSSAIDEDQRDHTFAGVHLTELGVPRGALPIAITRCWASALDPAALGYRQAHGMSIQGIRMAVLIQPMLNPVSSGVGFTVNPLTGASDEFIIEATWGLGESLVGGQIQPYFYKLANQPPDYPLIEHRPGNVPPPAEEVQPTRNSPLAAAQLTELAIQLTQVQALMGEAQDVEWARQDDAFLLLQTRPIAALPVAAQKLDIEWTRGSHPEFLPELPSPLFGSLMERTQTRAISFFKDIGLQVDGLGPYVKLILGRPYLNLTFLKRIISQVGLNPGSLLHTIGHTEPGGSSGTLAIDWATVWRRRHTYWLILKRAYSNSRHLKAFQASISEAVTLLEDVSFDASPATLLAQLRQHERIYNDLGYGRRQQFAGFADPKPGDSF
ncbi:MAG: PEP/pyruvate-binding domain-containing protein [Chloroflexi bacterium]|nr:PEP/pyruvate-binding domain-containing protein [Chloroflexota bacterium]